MDTLIYPVIFSVLGAGALLWGLNNLSAKIFGTKKAELKTSTKRLLGTLNSGYGFIAATTLYTLALWLLSDPLTSQTSAITWQDWLLGVALLAWPVILTETLVVKKRWVLLLLMLGAFGLGTGAVLTPWGGLIHERETLETRAVLSFMEERRTAALECAQWNHNLLSFLDAKVPRNDGAICVGSKTSWEYNSSAISIEPVGWRYQSGADSDVSDGVFEFSIISRLGEIISCTQEKCEVS